MKLSIRKFLLSLTLLVPALQQTACADNVTYLYRSWNSDTKELKTTTESHEVTKLSTVAMSGEWMGLGDGWFFLDKNITIQTLNILGSDVHLILGDGYKLECQGGVKLEQGHKLTIYGQSDGTGKGELWAHHTSSKGYKNMAGIGSGKDAGLGELVIQGGKISAEGGSYGAGIGYGAISKTRSSRDGKVIIYGGEVTANGSDSSAGIGCGSCFATFYNNAGYYIQYGGTVKATGGELGPGVGGGGPYSNWLRNKWADSGSPGKIEIWGGELTAEGGDRAAGIGQGSCSNIVYLNLKSDDYIKIHGGTVRATAGNYAAGIGGGCNMGPLPITITGGTVVAIGKKTGAGIGGGEDGYGGTITITGGSVEATAGDECGGTHAKEGSAIGSGYGYKQKDNGENVNLTIGPGVKVAAGGSKSSIERVFAAPERVAACHWRNYCKVEVCDHTDTDAFSYTQVGDEKHRKYCKYCGYQNDEDHHYVSGKCACGKEGTSEPETWTVTIYQATSSSSTAYGDGKEYKVLKGQQFPVPAPDNIEGLTFMQWLQNPASAPKSIEMKDSDFDIDATVALEITPTADVTLYAQYRYAYNEEWTWSADHSSAKLTLKLGDEVVKSNIAAEITTEEQEATDSEKGYKRYYATAKWEKEAGVVYQITDTYQEDKAISLTLKDDADNDDLLWENHGAQVYEVELSGRTIYRDGKWNTLVLPFDIDDLEGTALSMSDLDLRTLSASSYDATTKTLKLTFTEATKIEAGKPYIIRSKNVHIGYTELSDPTFRNVTINATDNSVQTDVVDFIGTYSPIELDASMTDVLYLGKNNTLRWPKGNTTLKSCRAAFMLKGAAAGADAAASRVLIDFGDGEVTGIETLERIPVLTGEDSNVFYTLGGRRMTGSQSPRGIYINKGKKVIIK